MPCKCEDENWWVGKCPECETPWEIVRPGKSQPVCACQSFCGCGSYLGYHSTGDYPSFPNFSGYFCNRGGPMCDQNFEGKFPVVADLVASRGDLYIHDYADHRALTVKRVRHVLIEVKTTEELETALRWLKERPTKGIFRDQGMAICCNGLDLTEVQKDAILQEGSSFFNGTALQRYRVLKQWFERSKALDEITRVSQEEGLYGV